MVRAMNTTATITSLLPLRYAPCGFRSTMSALRGDARIGHAVRMCQAIPTIHSDPSGMTMIGSVTRAAARDPAAVLIRDCRCRDTNLGEAE